jgi:hypothetical protein
MYHAREHVAELARILYGADVKRVVKERARWWTWLDEGRPERVVEAARGEGFDGLLTHDWYARHIFNGSSSSYPGGMEGYPGLTQRGRRPLPITVLACPEPRNLPEGLDLIRPVRFPESAPPCVFHFARQKRNGFPAIWRGCPEQAPPAYPNAPKQNASRPPAPCSSCGFTSLYTLATGHPDLRKQRPAEQEGDYPCEIRNEQKTFSGKVLH